MHSSGGGHEERVTVLKRFGFTMHNVTEGQQKQNVLTGPDGWIETRN